jgi:molybdopterin-containing oxidoreductase family iron-sulfur binding subunit
MPLEKKYYQGIDELRFQPDPQADQGKADRLPEQPDIAGGTDAFRLKGSRRDFIRFAGYSAALSTLLHSCEKPVHKAIPFLFKPEESTPGQALYYASTFYDGDEYCSILVKSRDGRPIKIEGNPRSSISQGGTSARVQASILDLYDPSRYRTPLKDGREISWETADGEIAEKLRKISNNGGKIMLLTATLISPFTRKAVSDFLAAYPSARHIRYDAVSFAGMRKANGKLLGQPVIPSFHFSKADLIVSFDADFLGTWLNPVEFTHQYASRRRISQENDNILRHIQFESGLSLTGSNADERYPVKPSGELLLLLQLFNEVSALAGKTKMELPDAPENIKKLAIELHDKKGRSLIVAGSPDEEIQLVAGALNLLLENYETAFDIAQPVQIGQGMDEEMIQLADSLKKGEIDALLVYNTNPAYDYPDAAGFIEGLKKTGLTITLNSAPDETSAHCRYVCPSNHYLESWGDAEYRIGSYSLQQPVIHPLFQTRQPEESLLAWSGSPADAQNYLKDYWQENIYPAGEGNEDFQTFWIRALQTGIFERVQQPVAIESSLPDLSYLSSGINAASGQPELHLYEKVSMGTGRHANNPWLQEMPDPLTKAVWDNYALVSPKFAADNDLSDFDMIRLNDILELPVLIQPGQAYGTLSVALGYGRSNTGKIADGTGVNAYPLAEMTEGKIRRKGIGVRFEKTGKQYPVARSQTHSSMEGRPIVRESTLKEYRKDPRAGNELHEEIEKKHVSLYADPVYKGFSWGLSVDLNACTGCGACLIACQAENNIPVVGKTEVMKNRIMHWIRIDRYFSGDPEKPDTVHQPVMCQHCDHAPCENVCPVSATPHSDEGLNQVAYTRCIGTKYCINNCPYKVRKFNWFQYAQNKQFDYNANSDLGRLVLNPDVTVRERGVVEKCSFCVQRIQEKKLQAKLENRILSGEEIQPACVQACPAKAMVFGDLNNRENQVSLHYQDPRNYFLLEELHTLPSVGYLTKIRNRDSLEKET